MHRKLNVLVVDDEQVVLDSVGKLLKRENLNLHLVLTPMEGLERVKSDQIDIVLTDLMMPEIDGLELMKMVQDVNPHIPVIIITGYATINTALQATQLGAFDYVAKPFSKKELTAVIRRAVDLVTAVESGGDAALNVDVERSAPHVGDMRTLGDQSWMMLEEDGIVVLGVEQKFVADAGRVQSLYLPSKGDEIRQGSVYLQLVSPDFRSHNVLSPLSGIVVEVNERVLNDPNEALTDPYGDGWIIKLKPTRFNFEIKLLGR
jgi:CheY-like chemotaxis protein/glycine cleavage system H lipoate-binding protein